jgi:hypothetical protein
VAGFAGEYVPDGWAAIKISTKDDACPVIRLPRAVKVSKPATGSAVCNSAAFTERPQLLRGARIYTYDAGEHLLAQTIRVEGNTK